MKMMMTRENKPATMASATPASNRTHAGAGLMLISNSTSADEESSGG